MDGGGKQKPKQQAHSRTNKSQACRFPATVPDKTGTVVSLLTLHTCMVYRDRQTAQVILLHKRTRKREETKESKHTWHNRLEQNSTHTHTHTQKKKKREREERKQTDLAKQNSPLKKEKRRNKRKQKKKKKRKERKTDWVNRIKQ